MTSATFARATAAQVRSMPSASIGSSVGAQSRGVDHRERYAVDLDLARTASRVVPGIGVTMATSSPAS